LNISQRGNLKRDMPKKKAKIDEEAIRQRIRQELEEKHQQKQESRTSQPKAESQTSEQINLKVVDRFIREKLEEELYSAHPEFIRCENHLGEVRWFTVFELENENEFYPNEESRFKKFFSRLFPYRTPKIINKEQAKKLEERLHLEIQEDIERRLQVFNKQREEKGITHEYITGADCTLCGRCIDVCHTDALKFDFRLKGLV